MKKLLLLLIIPFLSFGQGWEKLYDVSEFNDVEYFSLRFVDGQQTNDGGYIVLGLGIYIAEYGCFGETAQWERPFVIKLDSEGNEEWQKIIFEDYERMNMNRGSIIQTTDGGYALVGDRFSYDIIGWDDTWEQCTLDEVSHSPLLKLFENGYEEWSQTYSNGQFNVDEFNNYVGEFDNINTIKQSSDNGYIMAGTSSSQIGSGGLFNGEGGTYIIKTDINGIEELRYPISVVSTSSLIEWVDTLGIVIGNIFVKEVLEVNNGYVILELKAGFNDFYSVLTKINYNGDVVWYSNFVNSPIIKITNTSDGGFIGSGLSSIIKLNSDGQEVWSQNLENEVKYATQTADQGYIVLTKDENEAFNTLLKTNSYGEIEWEQNYEIQGGRAKATQTNDGGYVIFGEKTPAYSWASNLCIIKTNEFGNITSTLEYPSINKNLITTIDILGRETANNKGFQLHIYDDGSVEKKYLIK